MKDNLLLITTSTAEHRKVKRFSYNGITELTALGIATGELIYLLSHPAVDHTIKVVFSEKMINEFSITCGLAGLALGIIRAIKINQKLKEATVNEFVRVVERGLKDDNSQN